MRIDDGEWLPMHHTPRRDPLYTETLARERTAPPPDRRMLKGPGLSTHIWSGYLPAALQTGGHVLTVRAHDPYAGTLVGHHVIDVVPD